MFKISILSYVPSFSEEGRSKESVVKEVGSPSVAKSKYGKCSAYHRIRRPTDKRKNE